MLSYDHDNNAVRATIYGEPTYVTVFIRTAAAIFSLCLFAPATAQDGDSQSPPPPPPPCQEDVYRAFDFWLGEWDVATPDGQFAGVNVISEWEGGCLILEEWTGATGGTGQSYNFYDPGMEKWRQVWVSGFGTIDYSGGLNDDGEMVLEGEIAYRNGVTAPFRGVWTPNDDGTVTQSFQQYDADAEQWDDWFTGVYTRRTSEEESSEDAE